MTNHTFHDATINPKTGKDWTEAEIKDQIAKGARGHWVIRNDGRWDYLPLSKERDNGE